MSGPDIELANEIRQTCLKAGRRIMEIYADDFDITTKSDSSPVTAADQQAEDIILADLADLTPDIPVIAEEQAAAGKNPKLDGGEFWLVDPLDGTREFISRNGEFTVNVALIRNGVPVLGVVHTPAKGFSHWGVAGKGAFRAEGREPGNPICVRVPPAEGLTAMVSRSHKSPETDAYLKNFPIARTKDAGSSLKLCLLAEGYADLYPRLGRTMEWDIAAGHGVLLAAGGRLETLDGGAFTYGKPGFENPHFVAFGGAG
jgi:3'(2'), 5'-bisphosphate nucleotidase